MFSSYSPDWCLELVITYSTFASWGLRMWWQCYRKLKPELLGVSVGLNVCG